MNIDDLIAKWGTRRIEDEDKFRRCFPESDDLVATVLRGHLLVEEYIDRLNRHCFHFPEHYDSAQLRFKQKLQIAKAQILLPHKNPDEFYSVIELLNELRNNLAHNLESPKLENKITNFLVIAEGMYPEDSQINIEPDDKIVRKTGKAISFILGQLHVLDNVVEFMEKSRTYGGKGLEK
jgi:hypothetical protein